MPVYKQTYRQYTGEYLPHSAAWLVIAWKGIQKVWQYKWLKFFRFVFIILFLAHGARLYLAANLDLLEQLGFSNREVEEIIAIDAEFYHQYLVVVSFFCLFITLAVAPSLIAADRHTKAIPLYLSKSLTKLDYVFGKGGILLFYLYIVTVLAGLALMVLYALFIDSMGYLIENRDIAFQVFVYGNLIAVPLVFISLAVSSMSSSRTYVSAILACVYFLAPLVSNFFREISITNQVHGDSGSIWGRLSHWLTTYEWWSLFSLNAIWSQLGSAVFREELEFELHWAWHAGTLALVCALCAFVLYRQIKAVEVVK